MKMEVVDLTRRFGSVTALDGVSFCLEPGKVTGFVGPNGAGKSTALRILAGRDLPDAGDVLCDGISLCDYPEKCVGKIGFMPDALDDSTNTNVEEHLDLTLRLHGVTGRERIERLLEIVRITGLQPLLSKTIASLSKGMRQRVSLARILAADPEILLLDEPAAGLDPRARIELRDILRALAGRGKTVFLSSHILSELDDLCDSTIIIEKGKLKQHAELHTELQDTLLLTTTAPAAELAEKLAAIPEVRSATPEGKDKVRILLQEGEDPARFAARLISEGIPVTGFEVARQHLEELFLDATKGEVQ